MSAQIPAVVIGATGYVGGELLRLIAGHPNLELAAAVSSSQAGGALAETFPHLAAVAGDRRFAEPVTWLGEIEDGSELAVFGALPHGMSAEVLSRTIEAANKRQIDIHVVDASADFRFTDQALYEDIYGAHGAPSLLPGFSSGIPEHVSGAPTPHIGNPGCFATAMLLAIVPLLRAGIETGTLFASGITGSTGSGRVAKAGTHHPERHSNLYAYKPLVHRHASEVLHLAALETGTEAELAFVPHSGPFARGIHMTVMTEVDANRDAVVEAFVNEYSSAPFVNVVEGAPKLKDVVASNYANLGIAVEGRQLVVTSVIDNLVKGAAGGAVQWMNRLFDLPDTTGLEAPAPAWT